jgi:hypothetical protein
VTGIELYDFAAERAANGLDAEPGNQGPPRQRFPHAIYRAGDLGAFDGQPGEGLWILEIQIAHPELPYGAFHEDLLA